MDAATPVVAVWKSSWLPASETFVANQLEALHRWTPVLVGLRTEPDGLPVSVLRAPFSLTLLGKAARRASAIIGYRYVYDRALRRSGAQLIHAHFGTGGISVLPIAKRLKLPLVVTFHGYDVTRAPFASGRKGRAYRESLKEVFEYASALVAVSEFIASRLVELGAPPEKVRVKYIGTTISREPVTSGPRHGIVFVGRLVEVKGVADLIAAVALLPPAVRSRTDVRIAGFGPDAQALRASAATTGVDVQFLGRLSSEDVASLLASALIFCGPSRTAVHGDSEAFGTVFLEAAMQSLPVVAYQHGGVGEAVTDGETGVLVKEGDIRALASALERLIDHPKQAERMGANGRERVLKEFDIANRTALLEDLYDAVTHS